MKFESLVGAGRYDALDWVDLVRARLESLNTETIGDDVRPFLERPQDAGLLTRDNLLGLLRSARSAEEDKP